MNHFARLLRLTSSWGICWWPFVSWWTGQSVCSGRQTTLLRSHWQYWERHNHTHTSTHGMSYCLLFLYPDIKMPPGILLKINIKRYISASDGCKCKAADSYCRCTAHTVMWAIGKYPMGSGGEKQTNTTEMRRQKRQELKSWVWKCGGVREEVYVSVHWTAESSPLPDREEKKSGEEQTPTATRTG